MNLKNVYCDEHGLKPALHDLGALTGDEAPDVAEAIGYGAEVRQVRLSCRCSRVVATRKVASSEES